MESDTQYEEHTIASVEDNGLQITFDNRFSLGVPPDSPIKPKPGMTARLYGEGIGRPVRGMVIDGVTVFYRTEAEEIERHRLWVEDLDRKKKEDFEANREELDRRVAALPEVFQKRLDKFRSNNENFRWEYEPYELFTCEQAVVIADALKTVEALQAWHALSWDEQKAQVTGLDDGHSGNTFGMACALALHYLSESENVVKLHGALAPLVGSEEYGCVPKGKE